MKYSVAEKFVALVKMMEDPRTLGFKALPGGDFLVTATRQDALDLIELSLQTVSIPPAELDDGTWLTVFASPHLMDPEAVNGHKK